MKITVVPNNTNNLDKYIKAGAKAFIFGLKDYSINYFELSIDEIKKVVNEHKNIEIFISVNKTIFNNELENLENKLIELDSIGIKGVLFYDLGILSLYHKHKFKYSLCWHQTHMVTNYNTVNYYYDKGVEYAYLASEITEDEILEIKKKTPSKLFTFLVGYPIMAHSKRKLLTNYYESLNKEYDKELKLIEEHDKSYIVKETKDGTCIFDNNIVNGIDYLLELSSIDYGVIHGFNIDNDLLEKIVYLVNDILENKNNTSSYELKQLIGDNTGFFNKKTIFKVKKDEK